MEYEYEYKKGKQRIENILNRNQKILKKEVVPKDDSEFTFDNGIKSWISAIFVDIRDSTNLFINENDRDVAKMVRAFTSEIITILNLADEQREIGIRGDCVYGIFSTYTEKQVIDVFDLCVWINTELNMLNKLLAKKGLPIIKAGIGFAIGNDVIIKVGKKGSGINGKVWTGTAVVTASKLSSYGEKKVNERICLSKLAYDNLIDGYKKRNNNYDNWIKSSGENREFYYCDMVKSEFNKWINRGMPQDG